MICALRCDARVPKCDTASVMRGTWMEGVMGKPDSGKSPPPPGGEQETHSGKTSPPEKTAQKEIINSSKEIGGPKGPEPTRYGDWERKGIVSDF